MPGSSAAGLSGLICCNNQYCLLPISKKSFQNRDKQVFLVLEIQVEGTLSDFSLAKNIFHMGLVIAVAAYKLLRTIEIWVLSNSPFMLSFPINAFFASYDIIPLDFKYICSIL